MKSGDRIGPYLAAALELGLEHVESGPLVRSSYHAHEQTKAFERHQ